MAMGGARKMPYTLSENREKQYIIVTHTDEISPDELKSVQHELVAQLKIRRWNKICFDMQKALFPPSFSLISHFTLVESYKSILPSEVKIAAIQNPEQKLHGDAVEKAGQLSQVNIKSFTSKEKAIQWLS